MPPVLDSAKNLHETEGRLVMPQSDNENFSERESKASIEQRDTPVLSGAEVRGATPVPVSKYAFPQAEVGLISIIVETVWAWIVGIRMRLKIKKDLGRKATDADLTSIDTWIKVDEAEQQNRRKGPLKPD
jgi:hypothetical protein